MTAQFNKLTLFVIVIISTIRKLYPYLIEYTVQLNSKLICSFIISNCIILVVVPVDTEPMSGILATLPENAPEGMHQKASHTHTFPHLFTNNGQFRSSSPPPAFF